MTIKPGDKIPTTNLSIMGKDGPKMVKTDELFKGKKIALFGLPGAFTPTCSAQHVPSYVKNASSLKAKGIDRIICMSVNDCFVRDAWGKEKGVLDKIIMAADGSSLFTKALGLELDLTERGMGMRCQRFSMIVDDCIVKILNHEPPGEYRISSAEYMIDQL